MSLFRKIALTISTISAAFLMGCSEQSYNMREGVTEISKEVYQLHMVAVWVCVVIGIITFGAMFYSMVAHRKSKNPVPAKFSHSTTVEIIWTVIPFIILIALAIPAIGLLIKMEDSSNSDVTVLVKASQWKWQYEYVDGDDNPRNDVKFFSNLAQNSRDRSAKEAKSYSFNAEEITDKKFLLEVDNPLVIPVNKKVRFLVTADDVIHSFWVPDFSVKKDAVPGFINEVWTNVPVIGTYRGVCAELCGKDHGFMPIVVEVVSQEDYDAYMAEKVEIAMAGPDLNDRTMAQLMSEGEAAYNTSCVACHGKEGQGGAGPALVGGALTTGDMAGHIDMVLNGSKANPLMAAYGSQLSPAQLAAIITYERNAWGNDMGDKVQPQQIQDILDGKSFEDSNAGGEK